MHKPRLPSARRSQPTTESHGALPSAAKSEARRGEPVVAAILDAALDEIARVGFTAMSVETVAERAGVNKTTVYRRFPSKVELTAAALLTQHDRIAKVDTGTFVGDLAALLKDGCRFLSEARGQSLFRMLLADATSPEVTRLADQLRREGERVPLLVFQRAIARGELSPEIDLHLLLGTVTGILVHRILVERGTFSDDDVDKLVSMIAHGVVVAPPKQSVARLTSKRR